MVFTAKDLSKWENFPKGLRVLLFDGGDGISTAETRSKLESMDYIVTTFTDESEALSAVFKSPESFHIAIMEVNTSAENECFKFLEAAKDLLPTIMISNDHCIATTMKCIALGAVEFLQKPLSPEKLKNIWQHVVHKAFNDGGASVKESVVSMMLHLDTDMTLDEKDQAPSTPQLAQVSRLQGGDRRENTNCSVENVNSPTEKENTEDHESESVDTTNHEDNVIVKEEKGNGKKEEEEDTGELTEEGETGDQKSKKTNSVTFQKKGDDLIKPVDKSLGIKNLSGNKASRKKVDWTQGLHKKFVQAVEQLGIDQAIPSRILELMKVDGLTRHNVASHLQKFRMHRKNILPKVHHNHRWIQSRENHRQIQRQYNGFQQQHRPVMAYPVWGLPGVHPPGAIPPLWPPPLPPSGQLPQWHWKPPYPTANGNAWGFPVGPPVVGTLISPQDEEMIDQMVKEAISKPGKPSALGLKLTSVKSILAELSHQGISAVPSSSSSCLINGTNRLR